MMGIMGNTLCRSPICMSHVHVLYAELVEHVACILHAAHIDLNMNDLLPLPLTQLLPATAFGEHTVRMPSGALVKGLNTAELAALHVVLKVVPLAADELEAVAAMRADAAMAALLEEEEKENRARTTRTAPSKKAKKRAKKKQALATQAVGKDTAAAGTPSTDSSLPAELDVPSPSAPPVPVLPALARAASKSLAPKAEQWPRSADATPSPTPSPTAATDAAPASVPPPPTAVTCTPPLEAPPPGVSLAVHLSQHTSHPKKAIVRAIFTAGVPVLGCTSADVRAVLAHLQPPSPKVLAADGREDESHETAAGHAANAEDARRPSDEQVTAFCVGTAGTPTGASQAAAPSMGMHGQAPVEPPDEFTCPITQELMRDPVFCTDGHTYERCAIEAWLATGKGTSPKAGTALEGTAVFPNHVMRRQIIEWREAHHA